MKQSIDTRLALIEQDIKYIKEKVDAIQKGMLAIGMLIISTVIVAVLKLVLK
jgi:hypothetical protein